MSGLNPFRHKKAVSTAAPGAVAAPETASSSSSQTAASDSAYLPTAQPGNRPRGQDKRQTGQDDDGRRPGPAEEWLAGLEVDVARQKHGQTQQHYGLSRPLFENSTSTLYYGLYTRFTMKIYGDIAVYCTAECHFISNMLYDR